ncbi:MAG: VCBS repeat-containing protein [Acidobacteria bacterium]|nr:VCBS repeat-containing protein [Acidobacteriota bacterium]
MKTISSSTQQSILTRLMFGALALLTALATASATQALPQKAVLDFDGDNKTDYAVVRLTNGALNWYLQQSTAGFRGQAWGTAGDEYVPGDYDGDGKWDIAVWRAGTFYILQSLSGALRVVPFGQAGDDPLISQDFDGDGKCDPAVSRNAGSTQTWYILRSTAGFTSVAFGNGSTDTSIRGDFDGDGKADVAVYRRSDGTPANTFYVLRSTDGAVQGLTFGDFNNDNILPADFDGDGKTDYAVRRASNATWYWIQTSDGSFHGLVFGLNSDKPVPGDYDGDGKTDQAVRRIGGSNSTFYVNRSTLGFTGLQFGTSSDEAPAQSLQVH